MSTCPFEINGVPLLGVTTVTPNIQSLDAAAGTGRSDTSGIAYRDQVGIVHKFNFEFKMLTQEQMTLYMRAIIMPFFDFTFISPIDGNTYTTKFYVGDRTMPVLSWDSQGAITYEGLTMNFVEQTPWDIYDFEGVI